MAMMMMAMALVMAMALAMAMVMAMVMAMMMYSFFLCLLQVRADLGKGEQKEFPSLRCLRVEDGSQRE